jgi:hypothetical protein
VKESGRLALASGESWELWLYLLARYKKELSVSLVELLVQKSCKLVDDLRAISSLIDSSS